MPEAKDTATEEVAETEASQVTGTEVDESTVVPEAEEAQDKVDKAEYEAKLKEINKLQQELNLRRNKEKELELKNLEETGKYKDAYEKLKAEEAIREEEAAKAAQEKEVKDIRDGVLKEFPEVADVAEKLDVWWDPTVENYEDAKVSLREKLETLQQKLSPKQEENQPEIDGNNPVTRYGDEELDKLFSLSAEEMRKQLPKADPR